MQQVGGAAQAAPFGMGVVPNILAEGSHEEKGETAQMSNFVGAIAVTDLVKTTLGPKGMDKILQSQGGSIMVTNDGATILRSLLIDNPAAKVLIEISKAQDDEIGDGTTSVCCFAGELLREAEKLLLVHLHPQIVVAGYRKAAAAALERLESLAVDYKADKEKFKKELIKLACTTLSSKVLAQSKQHFAELAVDAVLRLEGSTNLDLIQIIKLPGGSLRDSWLEPGFLLQKRLGVGQPKIMHNAKILVANTAMDTDKAKIYGARVRVDSLMRVAEIESAEQAKMLAKCERIAAYNCNVFVNRQLIYNRPEQFFSSKGIMAIEHADFDGVERLSLVTGTTIVSTFDDPGSVVLGECEKIEEVMIGEESVIRFSGCKKGQACTVVLRGANSQLLDEAERSLHDALCVLSQTAAVESRMILGAGCAEMAMAAAVDEAASREQGKLASAMNSFALALRALPTIIADNAGLDATELVAVMKAYHAQGQHQMGLDIDRGVVGDIQELGIAESFKLKYSMVNSAVEAAEMVIRVDDIVKAAPRRREDPYGRH
uniref:CCT-beta n=1 Tax=Timspurckia oligopyrenoides TaxID=708627 RepID=A0A7S0ZHN1_9RHOD|mmetsp:Transcript_5461/g.9626  ORF Transcript_5461/g.9626 Transcript_5461/m.9626 type:complete len:545 (+) Transcript_5461:62-1696(+)